jgi:hypothetical protein
LQTEGWTAEINRDGTADAMYRIPWEEFIEWQEMNNLSFLRRGFFISARVQLQADAALKRYLGAKRRYFRFAERYPRDWKFLVHVILESFKRIRKAGFEPETVEIFVRWSGGSG